MLEDTQAPLLLTQERLLERLPQHGAKVIGLDRDWEAIARHEAAHLPRTTTADSPAYVIYIHSQSSRIHRVAGQGLWLLAPEIRLGQGHQFLVADKQRRALVQFRRLDVQNGLHAV